MVDTNVQTDQADQENSPLSILVLHPWGCIRVQKQAYALLNAGHSLYFITDPGKLPPELEGRASGVIYYRYKTHWWTRLKYRNFIKQFLPNIDIIHCHNEPNTHVLDAVKSADGKVPVIYDIHDFTSQRKGKPDRSERLCFESVNGIVHSTPAFQTEGRKRYPAHQALETIIYSAPSRLQLEGISRLFRSAPARELHLVYQGGLIDKNSNNAHLFWYRNYTRIFREILSEDLHLHVYCANGEVPQGYHQLQKEFPGLLHLNNRVPYTKMVSELSQYDWGLLGFNFEDLVSASTRDFLNAVIPNKLFDYLHAGIPSIIFNADTAGDLVRQHQIGLIKRPDENWRTVITRGQPVRDTDFQEKAREFTMESQIPKLVNFYREVIQHHH